MGAAQGSDGSSTGECWRTLQWSVVDSTAQLRNGEGRLWQILCVEGCRNIAGPADIVRRATNLHQNNVIIWKREDNEDRG